MGRRFKSCSIAERVYLAQLVEQSAKIFSEIYCLTFKIPAMRVIDNGSDPGDEQPEKEEVPEIKEESKEDWKNIPYVPGDPHW